MQVVLVSGHLDSWDVGEGAMDDGGGAFISWQALSLISQLKLRPKRTLRAVLWTAEVYNCTVLNSLPNNNLLDSSKLKAFADNKSNVDEKSKLVLGGVENIVGKG